MNTNAKRLFPLILLAAAIVLQSGCSYMKNRGNDLSDVFDVGITVTPKIKPEFALYVDFFTILPIGYSSLDNKLLGLENRKSGYLDYTKRSWGLILWGSEKQGSEPFNPLDPHQARDDQRDLTERPKFDTGIVSRVTGDDPPPSSQIYQCDKLAHIGWVGILLNCRILELMDFVAGWTTLDFMDDDGKPREVAMPQPASQPAASR
jgi:hypothetical protein